MIHVLIERHIAPDMESTYEQLARNTLHLAYQARGFINGETFTDMGDNKVRFVMSKWRSVQDWQLWYGCESRKGMMNEMNLMLSSPEKITLLEN